MFRPALCSLLTCVAVSGCFNSALCCPVCFLRRPTGVLPCLRRHTANRSQRPLLRIKHERDYTADAGRRDSIRRPIISLSRRGNSPRKDGPLWEQVPRADLMRKGIWRDPRNWVFTATAEGIERQFHSMWGENFVFVFLSSSLFSICFLFAFSSTAYNRLLPGNYSVRLTLSSVLVNWCVCV